MLPGAILTIGAGFIFGLGRGFLAVSAGSTLGAALAFLVGRFLARDKIRALTADKPKCLPLVRVLPEARSNGPCLPSVSPPHSP
jgi:membrane protein DedA with SNARE-associated domain